MTADQKPCVRCQRGIDRYARMCVYCNWDQSEAVPAPPEPSAAPAYVPPADNRARNRLLGFAALVALIILAFVVGTLIHGFEPSEAKATPNKQTSENALTANVAHGPRSNVTLIPVTDSTPTAVLEAPVTSAPPQTPGQEPNDATALPSDEYAAIAAKAKAQKQTQAQAQATIVDPRALRGRAYEMEPPPRPARVPNPNAPMASSGIARTDALPEYRPLPAIRVSRDTTARLALSVTADGRVTGIDVLDPIPGATSRLVDAVQTWRFRPATINGTPVPARVTVTITLRAHG